MSKRRVQTMFRRRISRWVPTTRFTLPTTTRILVDPGEKDDGRRSHLEREYPGDDHLGSRHSTATWGWGRIPHQHFPEAGGQPDDRRSCLLSMPTRSSAPTEATSTSSVRRTADRSGGAPQKVNDDAGTNDQFVPSLAISPDGTRLFVGWYDRRDDGGNVLIRYYGRIARLGGASPPAFAPLFPSPKASGAPVTAPIL